MENKVGDIRLIKTVLSEKIFSMKIFDVGFWLGRTSLFPLMSEGTVPLLTEIEQKYNIQGTLVSHWIDGKYSVDESNKFLINSIKDKNNWYAVVTGLPTFPEKDGYKNILEDQILNEKVRGVRIYPTTYKFKPVEWCIGSLCETLIYNKIPLFIFHTETSFTDIQLLATSFPKLQIVLETQIKKIIYHTRMLLPLMKKCSNIYTDISNLGAPGLLEYVIKNIGYERLLFSSYVPVNDPLVPIGLLLNENISEIERTGISGGNIRRLIKGDFL